jgi:paraquat-inducible protein B
VTTQQADIRQGRKLSGIWIIPLLALVLGLYMVIHTWLTEGPEIEIAFSTASGLEQGKTKVKYRNVGMGLVEEVRLNDKFDGVIATVKLDRQALPLLREDTRFWVVTARVGLNNISGLDTLVSGAYIQLAPGTGIEGERNYVALENPPQTPAGAPGLRLQLVSEKSASVTAGDTVLYNGYAVGRVESMEFNADDRKAHYVIFIADPYHKLIDSATRFWDSSGISLSASAEGLRLQTGSIDAVLLGGVAFGKPPGVGKGEPVENNTEFKMYASYEDTLKNPFVYGVEFVVSFKQSIKGLLPGAPVEYRGIPIGRVERIMLKESTQAHIMQDREAKGEPIPVLIYLEPGRMEIPDTSTSVELLKRIIIEGVANGMRASMETGNLLSGAKYIGIDYYYGDLEEAEVGSFLDYPTIPTVATGLGQIEQKLTQVLDKINALPLDATVNGANAAIASLDQTLQSMRTLLASQSTQQLPARLDATLRELQETLQGFSPDSEAYQSLNSSLLRLNRNMGNLEAVTRTLSAQPNAAVMPSAPHPDPEPELRK